MNVTSEPHVFRVFKDQELLEVIFAEGLIIHTVRNESFLDLTGGGTSFAILGWNHPQVNEAIISQLTKYTHMDYKLWKDKNVELLADLVISNAPSNLKYVYYGGNSGAEACEAAMKISYQYHYMRGDHQRKWFISREQSYHGSTSDALALGQRPNLAFYDQMLSPFRSRIPMHHFKKLAIDNESEYEYAVRSAKQLENEILRIGPENVAGFVAETMMGGLVGDVPPSKGYWLEVEKVCRKYGVHLILDEVYCGTGVSGKYFCYEYDQVNPDLVFLSKTVSAGYGVSNLICTTEEIHRGIREFSDGRLQHTTTHQAHSLSVAAALAVQQIVCKPDFLSNVMKKGELFRDLLKSQLGDLSQVVDIRGRGLRFSLEHNIHEQASFGSALEAAMKEEGILVNAKWHRICFTPGLVISESQINFAADTFTKVFRKLTKKFQTTN